MIIQRLFSSKEQKARRAKWETENQSRPSQKDIDRQLKDPRSKREKRLDRELGIKDNPRYNKTQKEAIDAAKKKNFRFDLRWKNTTADKLAGDPAIRQEFRENKAKSLKRRKQADKELLELLKKADKKIAEDKAKREAERKAKKAAESKASIAKHEAKAAELRAKKEAGEQLKKNLKKGGKIALATGGVVAAGIGAKKLADKKKAKREDKK